MKGNGEIVGILLAAGHSRRFGSDKLLHRLPDGTPLAVAAARNLRPACDRLIACLRPDSERLARLLGAAGCETVTCPAAENGQDGMGHSLATGVRASPAAAGWLVALADMPFIDPASHQAVADSLRAGASLAAPIYHGRRGHPVGFAGHWFERLAALTGEQGGKSIVEAHRQGLVLCPVDDPGILHDIDRPADLDERSGKAPQGGPCHTNNSAV